MTIRRRGVGLLRRLAALPESAWQKAVLDIPKRRHQQIRYVDQRVTLPEYSGEARQVAVKGLGREQPTLFLSNNFATTPRQLVMDYAHRNGVEDALGSSVDFFHLDCLASEVRLNVDLDAVLTVLAQPRQSPPFAACSSDRPVGLRHVPQERTQGAWSILWTSSAKHRFWRGKRDASTRPGDG